MIEPEIGFLACQTEGKGRMAEPKTIFDVVTNHLEKKTILSKHRALVTAGPTHEPIDAVRFIGNYSSGLMGISIAEALADRGIAVDLVCGPTSLRIQHPLINRIDVKTAAEMFAACKPLAPKANLLVMAAAVADYTPTEKLLYKLKKEDTIKTLALKPTVDILKTLALKKNSNQIVVGFALETNNEIENARQKLHTKNADFIVLNSLNDEGAGFGVTTNKVSLIDASDNITDIPLQSKRLVAETILDHVLQRIR